jgi:hypothetical protein
MRRLICIVFAILLALAPSLTLAEPPRVTSSGGSSLLSSDNTWSGTNEFDAQTEIRSAGARAGVTCFAVYDSAGVTKFAVFENGRILLGVGNSYHFRVVHDDQGIQGYNNNTTAGGVFYINYAAGGVALGQGGTFYAAGDGARTMSVASLRATIGGVDTGTGQYTLQFYSGVTPTAFSLPGLFNTMRAGVSEIVGFDCAGNLTTLTSHNGDGEAVHESMNIYTGKVMRINLETGEKDIHYNGPKINPETAHKDAWKEKWAKNYKEANAGVKATKEQKDAAADVLFLFDWGTLPKYVRQAWGK